MEFLERDLPDDDYGIVWHLTCCPVPDPIELGYTERVIVYDVNDGIKLLHHNWKGSGRPFVYLPKVDTSWMLRMMIQNSLTGGCPPIEY